MGSRDEMSSVKRVQLNDLIKLYIVSEKLRSIRNLFITV